MDARSFFDRLMTASDVGQIASAIEDFKRSNDGVTELPIAGRSNNRGTIEVASDAGRSAIERVTNAQDALLELEHLQRGGKPDCRSPREAASAWLGVPMREGLSGLSVRLRQELAANVVVRLEPGESAQSRLLTVTDRGIGIPVQKLESTILSLNESNKIQKHYLAGTYGQGGSSTFLFCRYAVIASRFVGASEIGFTVVRYEDLPPEEYKTGRYVYLALDGHPLNIHARNDDHPHGTIVRHFGYDLARYNASFGPNSLYGILQRVLFDPVTPIRLESEVHQWRVRTIKGSRNALNGAVDEGDEGRGPELSHNVPMFYIELGDQGNIGIEYWVLARPEEKEGKKSRPLPSAGFVDPARPVILTHNGQNQGELTSKLIRQDADLPFLHGRLICHVNCDRLTPAAKRSLFSSTREQSREGHLQTRIREELISALKADDELDRLHKEAREHSLKEGDAAARKNMRREVARLLKLTGAAVEEIAGSKDSENGGRPRKKPGPVVKPEPIISREPPTFIFIVWEEDKPIPFYETQRRYLRIETDASSEYHAADDHSKLNVLLGEGGDLKMFGTSPLKGGRMRIGIECKEGAGKGAGGSIKVELYRKGLPNLSDERPYTIVEPPKPKEPESKSQLPDFVVVPVDGPEHEDWTFISENAEDTNVARHASGAIMNEGTLYVYYSTKFPRFASELRRMEISSAGLSSAFVQKYELWLAVHSFLMHQEQESQDASDFEPDRVEELNRQERCRLATMAAMMASHEVRIAKAEDQSIE
jgi:hypothetical protein